jgi:hypothetical protein
MIMSPGKIFTALGILLALVLLLWGCAPMAEPTPEPAHTPAPSPVTAPTPPLPEKEAYERTYPEIIRGFWMPALASRPMGSKQIHSVGEPATIKEFHANLAAFPASLQYDAQGEIDPAHFESSLPIVRSLIKEYHQNNISVFLTIEPSMGRGEPGQIPESTSGNDEFISGYDSCLEKLVALAEEEKVEYFAPMNEPDYKMGSETADVWSSRMLQIVQKGFTGRIVYKGALSPFFGRGEKLDFSGYSYVGFSSSPWNSNMEEYRQSVSEGLQIFLEWSREDDFEPMITEFGIWGAGQDIPEDKKAEAVAIVFEEGKKNGIKTYLVFDSPAGAYTQVKGSVLEAKVKEYFTLLEQEANEN